MKKFALVLALLAIAGFVFADTVVVPTLSGSAETVVGFNLQSNTLGINASSSATVAFTLIDAQSATTGGEDDLYGEITVSGFSLSGDDGDDLGLSIAGASASAKIVAGDLYVTIADDPTVGGDNAATTDVVETKTTGASGTYQMNDLTVTGVKDDSTSTAAEEGNVSSKMDGNAGFTIGMTGDVAWDIKIASVADYDTNAFGDWIVGGDTTITIADVGSVGLSLGFITKTSAFGASAKVPLTLGPAAVTIASDILYTTAVAYDLGVDVDLTAGPIVLGVKYYTYMFTDMDVQVSLDLSALAEGLSLKVAAGIEDLTATLGYTVDVDGSMDIGGIKPYLNFGYGSDSVFDLGVGAELGAAATGIDNTVIKIGYASSDLTTSAKSNGTVTASIKITL